MDFKAFDVIGAANAGRKMQIRNPFNGEQIEDAVAWVHGMESPAVIDKLAAVESEYPMTADMGMEARHAAMVARAKVLVVRLENVEIGDRPAEVDEFLNLFPMGRRVVTGTDEQGNLTFGEPMKSFVEQVLEFARDSLGNV